MMALPSESNLITTSRNNRQIKTETDHADLHPLAVLMIMMLGTALFIYNKYIFGHNYWIFSDVGSDTWNDYFPLLAMLAEKIKSGDLSPWCMNWGTGADLINNQSIICDPFNIPLVILYLVGGRWVMASGLIYIHIVKCLLTGYLTFLWLSEFNLNWYGRVMGAYVCAFNGFLVLWGQHYFFATACVFTILDIYQIERTIKNQNKSVWMILSIALTLATSLYTAFPIALTCLAYLVFRCFFLVDTWDTRKIIRKFAAILIDVIIAGLISGILSLPAYYQLTEVSARIGGNTSIPLFFDSDTFRAIFTRLFSNNLYGIGNNYIGPMNYYELSQLFFSCLGPSMMIIFFTEKIHRDSKRWLYVLLASVTGIMMLLPLGGAICNRFVTVATRYSFVYIPFMAYMIAWFFSHYEKLHLDTRITAFCCTVFFAVMLRVIYVMYVRGKTPDSITISHYLKGIMICLLVFAVIMISRPKGKSKNRIFTITVFCIITFSMITDSAMTNPVRMNITPDSESRKNIESTCHALETIQPGSKELFRIEKTYIDNYYNDAVLENYKGISYYNTTFSRYVMSFVKKVWPKTANVANNPGYVTFTADADNIEISSLLGVRYVLSKTPITHNYSLIGTGADGISIYENKNSPGFGRVFTNTMRKSDFLDLPETQRQKILDTTLVLEDPDYESTGRQTPESPATVKVWTEKNSGHMLIKVDSSANGYLYIPVTWDSGWTADVNGHQEKIYRADIGFQAVKLPSGVNIVELNYRQPLQREGFIASISGLLCLIALIWYKKTRGVSQ